MRTTRWRSLVLVCVFAVLRLYATLGTHIGVASDTPSYFVHRWWGGVRLPVITALYTLVENHRAIVIAQTCIGIACWSAAALLLGTLIDRPWVSTTLVAGLLVLGLTIPVVRFDTTLLSESLSISLVTLLVALLIRVSCQPSHRLVGTTVVVALLWSFARPNNAIVILVTAAAVCVVSFWVRPRRPMRYLAACLAGLGLAGVLLATSNTTVQQVNTAQILERRIIGQPSYEGWFREHGMPENAAEIVANAPDGKAALALMDDARFAEWMSSEGMGAHSRFLLTHPGYMFSTTIDDRYPVGAFFIAVDDWNEFGSSRAAVPAFVEWIFWPRRPSEGVLAALVLAPLAVVALVRVLRRRQVPKAAPMALAIIMTSLANVLIVTHTAGESYGRVLIASSTSARIATLWLLAAAFDSAPTPPASQGRNQLAERRSWAYPP